MAKKDTSTRPKPKSKAQIERDYPIIKPEECPGKLMEWISDRDETNFEIWMGMLRTELLPIKRFMRIASSNRIWLIGLTVVMVAVVIVLWAHLTQTSL